MLTIRCAVTLSCGWRAACASRPAKAFSSFVLDWRCGGGGALCPVLGLDFESFISHLFLLLHDWKIKFNQFLLCACGRYVAQVFLLLLLPGLPRPL